MFCGPIVGANGNVVVGAGECLDDGSMLGMDYWVQGVKGEVPGEAPGEPQVCQTSKDDPSHSRRKCLLTVQLYRRSHR
ncbi:MAG: hypothetical protein CM1200mP6_08800 [Anaerolineaceae bacterium]|nr:MAG: hypothetical protein CM1200mP6_08800 [Anaerolineaceae bacterium]